MLGADCRTFSTADAFCRLGLLYWIYIHGANIMTSTTGNTLLFVQMYAVETDFVQQTIDCSQGAHDFAEKAAADDTSRKSNNQYRCLYGEDSSQFLPQFRMRQQDRKSPFQSPCRADVLAECGRPDSVTVRYESRQKNNKKDQK